MEIILGKKKKKKETDRLRFYFFFIFFISFISCTCAYFHIVNLCFIYTYIYISYRLASDTFHSFLNKLNHQSIKLQVIFINSEPDFFLIIITSNFNILFS